jgi:glutamate synthase (NADPH/NADH) small chain
MQPTGKKEVLKADLVLLAMGFLRPEQPTFPANVFVCGDATLGATLVVRAIASARETAKKVDAFLSVRN